MQERDLLLSTFPLTTRKVISPLLRFITAQRGRSGRREGNRGCEAMSAFNRIKALVPIEWSPKLYVTLARGLPGTRRLHRRTLAAMRLRRCNRTVVHRTTPSLLGMLNQVKRLVVVETEQMYNARKLKQEADRAIRPPLVVTHHHVPPPSQDNSAA